MGVADVLQVNVKFYLYGFAALRTQINVETDPVLLVKKYEKQIRELKQELAMHDALVDRCARFE